MDGILNVYKPLDMSSHDVVAKVRKMLPGVKIGHAGTLDPMATGVLPLCLGKGTRLVEFMMDHKKGYRAGVELGTVTDTEDARGNILEQQPVMPFSTTVLKDTLKSLTGEQTQIPPAYSALKHKGKPLYYYARRGEEVERKPRRIHIYRLEMLNYNPHGQPHLVLEVECSRGTYIRTLATEIGRRLNCGAHLWSLERYYVGSFKLEDSYTLERLQQAAIDNELKELLIPMDQALSHLQALTLADEDIIHLKHGRTVTLSSSSVLTNIKEEAAAIFRVYNPDGIFCAIVRQQGDWGSQLKTVKYFPTNEG